MILQWNSGGVKEPWVSKPYLALGWDGAKRILDRGGGGESGLSIKSKILEPSGEGL